MKTTALHDPAERLQDHSPMPAVPRIEPLESRIAPAFVASFTGLEATFTGDATSETFALFANGAILAHNRFTAGDPGFASDLDFDSVTPGEQTFPSASGATLIVQLGAGNDSFSSTGNVAGILASLQVFGGPGNDTLLGGNGIDVLSGGPGNDFIDGQQGNDTLLGGDGDDTFNWDPGDGSDTIDGDAGGDRLNFNGSNAAEIFDYSAVNGRFRLFRNIANIVMSVGTVESVVTLNLLGGADTVVAGDLASTSLRHLHFHLGSSIGGPDGALDALSFTGSALNDDIVVRNSGSGIEVTGLTTSIHLDGFEATDGLTVSGGLGVDSVFAAAAVRAKLVLTTDGELENPPQSSFQLSTPAGYDVGKSPSAIASGDLFGVGNDLVVVNAKSNTVSILANAGNGMFQPALELSTGGKAPKSVALGDFNADGRLDIAVTNSGSANVAVLLNNGDGTFAAPALFPTGKTPGVLRAADLIGDGNTDLVMITAGNKLSILPGNGLGGFGAATTIATGGSSPVDFALGDFNADGRTDLAVAHAGSANVTVLTANADLTFGAPIKLRVGTRPSALAVGDFDGDGRADIAVTHSVSRFVSVLFNASAGGTTAFAAQLKLAHPGNHAPTALAVADLDQDGRGDLIVGNTASGSISILLNAGAASFRPALRIDLDNTPPRKTAALVVSDFNGDGRLDIAGANAATGDISLLFRLPA